MNKVNYLNLIFVKLNESKTKLQFTNSDKWHPLQKKWGSAIRSMKPGIIYCVATLVREAQSASGTTWDIVGVLAELPYDDEAIALNEHYWQGLVTHRSWSIAEKSKWAMDWGSALILEHLPEESITPLNQMTWRMMKLIENPAAFEVSVQQTRANQFNKLFEF